MSNPESDLDVLAQASAAAALSVSVKDNIADVIHRKISGRKRIIEFMDSIGIDTPPATTAGCITRWLIEYSSDESSRRWRWAVDLAKKAKYEGILGPPHTSREAVAASLNSDPIVRDSIVPIVVAVLREVNSKVLHDNRDIDWLTKIHTETETLCELLHKKPT
jgi:hypothetical protein